MAFENEGAVEVVLEGFLWYEVTDFAGDVVGVFSNWAAGLEAQRDANIKKVVIKKEAQEAAATRLYSCTPHLENDATIKGYAVHDGRWFGPSDNYDLVLRKAEANGVAVSAFQ